MKAKKRRQQAALSLKSPPPAPVSPKPLIVAICCALTVSGLLVYAQTFHYGFVLYDDDKYVSSNPMLKAGLSGAGIAWALTTFASANWHPFTWISWLLDAQLFGINPGAFHAVNVIFHVASAILLFLAFQRMTGQPFRSGLVAAVFLLHPLHVESVAWISERKDVLSTFCEMAALLLYARYAEVRTLPRYLTMAFAFALGLMAKPMLVTFPFILLLLDYWPLRRLEWPPTWRFAKPLVLEKIPLLALSVAASMLTFAAQQSSGAIAGLQIFSPATRVANALCAYIEYIGQSIWPANLAVLYPAAERSAGEAIAAGILLLAITAAAIHFAKQRPYLLTGWLWYAGMLVPVIGLIQVGSQSRADRYMYVPLVGLSIAAIWTVADRVADRPRLQGPVAAGAGLLLLLYGGVSYAQTRYWRDSRTLFEHTLAVTTDNPIIHNNLGMALFDERNYPAAAEHYRQAFTLSSKYEEAHYNLGLSLAAMGQFDAAAAQYRQALAIAPDYAEGHANLGHELMRSGQFDAAGKELESALRLKSEIPVVQADLGLLLAARGDYEGAAQHLLEASRLAPGDATNESNLCFVLAHAHRIDEAVTHGREAVTLDPSVAGAHFNLGSAFALQGRNAEARAEFAETLRLNPNHAEARKALADMAGR